VKQTRTYVPLLALTFALVVQQACSSPTPMPDVRLVSNITTENYLASGITTESIFLAIKAVNLQDSDRNDAVGLTEMESTYALKSEGDAENCRIKSMIISVEIKVTLPGWSVEGSVPPLLVSRWERFVESVKVHEERHVDIYIAGFERVRESVVRLPPRAGDCDALASRIRLIWEREQSRIEVEQEAFHKEDDERVALAKRPLQARLDGLKVELDQKKEELKNLDGQLVELTERLDLLSISLEGYRRRYPNLVLPEPDFSAYNRSVVAYNSATTLYNKLVAERTAATGQHNDLVEGLNSLAEEIAWVS
jgi:predicted secreted Zn-dependent protease